MTGGVPPENRSDVEALVADRYLEALLAAGDRGADDAPFDAGLDPETRRAVVLLRRALVRVHPSFRFEERLAGRLAELADARTAARGRADGIVVAFPPPGRGTRQDAADPLLPLILAGSLDPADDAVPDIDSRLAGARRPLLVGGAITSAALSLVGVAWVAWRATRTAPRNVDPAAAGLDPVSGGLGGLS
jgi:hypothetical protein